MNRKSTAAFLLGLLALPLHSQAATTLDFEGLANNVTLAGQYAALGATFTSTDAYASVRAATGFQAYPARSGNTVFATRMTGLTTVAFSHDVGDVSVWVLSPSTFGSKLTAYGAGGAVLATATNPVGSAYRQLAVRGVGIRSVTIQAPAGFAVIDDLAFTAAPVPEPATLAALGLGGVVVLRRRRG